MSPHNNPPKIDYKMLKLFFLHLLLFLLSFFSFFVPTGQSRLEVVRRGSACSLSLSRAVCVITAVYHTGVPVLCFSCSLLAWETEHHASTSLNQPRTPANARATTFLSRPSVRSWRYADHGGGGGGGGGSWTGRGSMPDELVGEGGGGGGDIS